MKKKQHNGSAPKQPESVAGFPAAIDPPMVRPPADAVKRYGAIPLLFAENSPAEERDMHLAYDSWSDAPREALRDIADGFTRRVQLRSGRTMLEMVAERRADRWEFVARVYTNGKLIHDMVLKAGRQSMLAGSGGFFLWSSKSVPQVIRLVSDETCLVFEGLSWR